MRTALSLAAVLVCAAGCQTIFGLDDPLPRDDNRLCWGSEVEICLPAPATGEKLLSGPTDTSTSSACEPSIAGYCVVAGATVVVGSTMISGGRPLVVIGAAKVSIEGVLDAASHPGKPGPGAMGASCNAFAMPPSDRGGGAGGSYGGSGGAGGGNNLGDTGGRPASILQPAGLRAGCRGQDGGRVTTNLGTAGLGGGAVYLISGGQIDVRPGAMVNASGAGGAGARCTGSCGEAMNGESGGAGGGGSGGMLIFEAPAISASGVIVADGGGGGQGASVSNDGMPGQDPDGMTAALGGSKERGGNSNGGSGGSGAHGATQVGNMAGDGKNSSKAVGGGGGGGGAGVVRVYGASALGGGAAVSPAPEFR